MIILLNSKSTTFKKNTFLQSFFEKIKRWFLKDTNLKL